MTRTDAGRIVAILSSAFPHPPITPERSDLLASEIGLLADPEAAFAATQTLVRNGDYFPTIHQIRAAYHLVAERQRAERERCELEPPAQEQPPTWIQVWTWARNERDPRERRAFLQQRPGFDTIVQSGDSPPEYLTVAEYEALYAEWQEAGSPTWKATEVLRTAGVAA